jgi:hypothetical protein
MHVMGRFTHGWIEGIRGYFRWECEITSRHSARIHRGDYFVATRGQFNSIPIEDGEVVEGIASQNH